MLHLFKRKKIVLDCFTDREDVHALHPISRAIKYVPSWWTQLPGFDETELAPMNTMRKCRGFIDLYDNSIVLPMWSDLMIKYDRQGLQYQFADMKSELANHAYSQRRGFLPENQDVKIISPWVFKCNKEINWMTFKPMYNYPNGIDFDVYPGIVNFKYQVITNINIVLPKIAEAKKFVIEANQPIWQLVPLTENSVDIRTHLISTQELISIRNKTHKVKFVGSYNYTKKILENKESKCPFSNLWRTK